MLKSCISNKKVVWNCIFFTFIFLFRSVFPVISKKKNQATSLLKSLTFFFNTLTIIAATVLPLFSLSYITISKIVSSNSQNSSLLRQSKTSKKWIHMKRIYTKKKYIQKYSQNILYRSAVITVLSLSLPSYIITSKNCSLGSYQQF